MDAMTDRERSSILEKIAILEGKNGRPGLSWPRKKKKNRFLVGRVRELGEGRKEGIRVAEEDMYNCKHAFLQL